MMVYLTTPEDNELFTDLSWRNKVREMLNEDEWQKFGKGLMEELDHFQETQLPRCPKCYADFIKVAKHEWMPTCGCCPNLRLMIG
jgi:hypothetical protein